MQFRKIFLIFLCLMLSFFSVFSISVINVNATEIQDTGEAISESKSATYTISIPQTILLDENGFAEYQISVNGDLSNVVSISVTPDETFALSSFDKEDITATVTQDKTVWTTDDASITAQGSISADLTAGVWNGVLNFNVFIEEKEDFCQDGHIDTNNDGKCDNCGEDVVIIEGIGEVTVDKPDAEIQYVPSKNMVFAAVPNNKNQPETPEEIPAERLNEVIEFNYGSFEAKGIYSPEEYVTVEHQTVKTRLKPPVAHVGGTFAAWTIENSQLVTSNEVFLSSGKLASTFIVYNNISSKPVKMNGVTGNSITQFVIINAEDDNLTNAMYIAAYYNKLDNTTDYHVAKWDGSEYVTIEVDSVIAEIEVFNETYVETKTEQVLVKAPSYSTEYVYIPEGVMKAEAGMTWFEWLRSDYNNLGSTDIVIRNSNYETINPIDEIISGESYSFVDAAPVNYDELAPGLYKSGSNYTEMIIDWATLIQNGTITINEYGQLYHDCTDVDNCVIVGDFVISKDAGIKQIGEYGYEGGFENHKKLTGLIIPEGVTFIGQESFVGCENLSKVIIPEGVSTINGLAFANCAFTSIGPLGCETDIELPSTITELSSLMFANCDFTYVELPEGVEIIPNNMFSQLSNLETVLLPNTLTTIGGGSYNTGVFYGCIRLTNINIPANVTRISKNTFENCYSLTTVTLDTTKKWYCTTSSDYTNGTEVDVSNPEMNAIYFTETYVDYYWYNEDDSGGSDDPCVTADTLITLVDGSKKRIDEITYNDKLLVWDSFNGVFTESSAAIIFDHGVDKNTVIELTFSDGTVVKVVNLHQFMDLTLNEYVSINKDTVAEYVGHEFAKRKDDYCQSVQLVSYKIWEDYIEAWGIISSTHYNILVEDMVSTDFMLEDYPLFNYFEYGEKMIFDSKKMQSDIEKYGLYTYDEFAEYLTPEQFEAFNVQYMKIAIGKGNYTYEQLIELIQYYLSPVSNASIVEQESYIITQESPTNSPAEENVTNNSVENEIVAIIPEEVVSDFPPDESNENAPSEE